MCAMTQISSIFLRLVHIKESEGGRIETDIVSGGNGVINIYSADVHYCSLHCAKHQGYGTGKRLPASKEFAVWWRDRSALFSGCRWQLIDVIWHLLSGLSQNQTGAWNLHPPPPYPPPLHTLFKEKHGCFVTF